MSTIDVKLLGASLLGGSPSPYVNRVEIGLNLKSVKYEFINETFFPKSELLLKSNPVHKKIPVLFHDDKPICESLIIVQYIDETWTSGPSILPSDLYDRAIARFWAAYLDDKWFPAVIKIRDAQEEEAKAAAIEIVVEGLILIEEAFINCSKGKDFFGGESIGYLDIAFGSYLGWLRAAEKLGGVPLLVETKTPNLVQWAERFSSVDVVKGVIPEADKLIEIFQTIMARVKARGTPK